MYRSGCTVIFNKFLFAEKKNASKMFEEEDKRFRITD